MAQTTKTITASVFEAVRTNEENGDKYLVVLVTYTGGSQERIVLPLDTVMPV